MKRVLFAIVPLLATFVLGTGVTMYLRHRHRQVNNQINHAWAANPCRDGLASVDYSSQPNLKITLLETSCENQTASVHFNVTNLGVAPIKYFQVRAIYTYDNYVDDGAELGTGPLVTGQSTGGFIGQGPPSFGNGKQVGQLRRITLIPSLLELEDGRKWRRPSIHEPIPK